jgi:hypothetical protein
MFELILSENKIARSFNFTFRYIDSILSLNNSRFGEYIDHGQATDELYHLRLRVECTFFCNLQSRARTHVVLVIGFNELLGHPQRNIVCTHMYADCLLKNTSTKHNKYVVYQKLEHVDDIYFW